MTNSFEKRPSGDKKKSERKIVGITPEIDKILENGGNPKKIQEEMSESVRKKIREEAFIAIQLERELLDSVIHSTSTPTVSFWELYQYARGLSSIIDEQRKYIEKQISQDSELRKIYNALRKKMKPNLHIVTNDAKEE
ncbi:MAG: hypothetical protein Q8R36_04320 [bacterium]|nr:hypothetical protein [bacterium]